MRYALSAFAVALLAACGLRPFPAPHPTCHPTTPAELWTCIGEPDPHPRESAFTSTSRVATGDMTRRLLLNQVPSLACNRTPWRGFAPIEDGSLIGFIHKGDADKAIVIVVHGLFDSNTNRYARYIASGLADDGFTVVVPDMRWHGCKLDEPALATAGLDESKDLAEWADLLRARFNRRIGLLGVSLGGLDVINAAARYDKFDAGAVVISPPAAMAKVLDNLDTPPTFAEHGLNKFFVLYFRGVLRVRNRRIGIPFWSKEPFHAFLQHVVDSHPDQTFPDSLEALLKDVEPATRLREVKHPMLILAADNDPVMRKSSAEALVKAAEGLPHIRVIETVEGGHAGIIGRDPQWFSDAIAIFFNSSLR